MLLYFSVSFCKHGFFAGTTLSTNASKASFALMFVRKNSSIFLFTYFTILFGLLIHKSIFIISNTFLINQIISSFKFLNLLILPMWKLKDSNVRIGEFIKVQTFKKHLLRLNSTASNLNQKGIKPWTPNFSISRNQNRYHKQKLGEIDKQNYHLLRRIADIQYNSKVTTLMNVPLYIPSNKENYVRFKNRERSVQSKRISRQNSMISSRIKSTERMYERRTLEEDWQKSRMVIKNISKKHRCRDYRKLAQSQIRDKRKTIHPQMSLNLNRLRQRKHITQQRESLIDRSSVQPATERSTVKLKKFF